MGAFENLFKRRSAKTATPGAAETSKTKSPVDDRSSGVATSGLLRKTSSKSKKASNIGASAGIDVPAVPPRVDLGILRTPSPPLVQVHVEGYRSDSPWVDLAAQTEPRRGSFGFGSYRTSSSSPTTRAVDDKLLEYLHGKLITPEQATLLVQECTKALQGQGLELLGIFRPWRLAESPYIITKTLALFLRAVCPHDEVPIDDRDLLGFSKDENAFNTFAEALADAGTHNTVACLKWGLRHLQYGPNGFGKSDGEAWSFYRSYVQSEFSDVTGYDRRAFDNEILEELPKEQSALLIVCLELFANVAAHDAQNAMSGLHLCRLLAFWLFGRQHQQWNDWSDLYEDYLMAAACLEHIFLSYLRSQDRVLPRLVYLITPYPPEHMQLTVTDIPKSMHHFNELSALHVHLEAEAPASSKSTTCHKRLPGALFASALQARHRDTLSEEFRAHWENLVVSATDGEGDGVDLQSILVDETERIFALIAEKAERNKRVRINCDKRTSIYGIRRRSASIDVGMMHSISSKSSDNSSTGRNRAVSNDARMQTSSSQPFDISWGDFETRGFGDGLDSDGFSLFSEIGRPSMDEEVIVPRPQKLKKPYPYASLASRNMQFERRYHPERDENSDSPANLTIKEITIVKIDTIFTEVYLDSLEDPGITSKWPDFAVSELKSFGEPYKAVIVEVESSNPKIAAVMPSSTSTTSITLSALTKTKSKAAPKPKRGLFSLGSRKKRITVHEPETQEDNDVKQKHQVQFDEFGKRIAVKSEARPISAPPSQQDQPRSKLPMKGAAKADQKPAPIAEVEEPVEERSSSSPSDSSGRVAARKVSRKAVPLAEDEDIVAAEVTKETGQAEPEAGFAADVEQVTSKNMSSTGGIPVAAKEADLDIGTTGHDTLQPHNSHTIVPIVIVSHEEDDVKSPEEEKLNSSAAADGEEAISHEDDAATCQRESIDLVNVEPTEDPAHDTAEEGIVEEPVAIERSQAIEPTEKEKLSGSSTKEPSITDNATGTHGKQRTEVADEPVAQSDKADLKINIPAKQDPNIAEPVEGPEVDVHVKESSEELLSDIAIVKAEDRTEPITPQIESSSQHMSQDDTSQERPSGEGNSNTSPRRFGSALNRVSPSLKERFVVPSTTQLSPEQEKPSEKSPKVQAPPSPSRRAAILSGAKKMLSRKKSSPGGLVADPSVLDNVASPLPRGDGPSSIDGPDKKGRTPGKDIDEVAPELEASPLIRSSGPKVQQVAVAAGTEATDSTDPIHPDSVIAETEEPEITSSSPRTETSPVSPVAATSLKQVEYTHQPDTVDKGSTVQAKQIGGADLQQAQDPFRTRSFGTPANGTNEEIPLHQDRSEAEVSQDLQPEQNDPVKAGTSVEDTVLEKEVARLEKESTHDRSPPLIVANEKVPIRSPLPSIADEVSPEHTTLDKQDDEARNAEAAPDDTENQSIALVEPTAAEESSALPSPLSSLLSTAQSTVAATAGSITTLAAAVLPSSLVGSIDAAAPDETEDRSTNTTDMVGAVSETLRESHSTQADKKLPFEGVQPTATESMAVEEVIMSGEGKDARSNSSSTPAAPSEDEKVTHSVAEHFFHKEEPVSSDAVSGTTRSEEAEPTHAPSTILPAKDVKGKTKSAEHEGIVRDVASASAASTQDNQQDLKASSKTQEGSTTETPSPAVEAPLVEVAVPKQVDSQECEDTPSEVILPARRQALELDGQQSQVQPPLHISENAAGHFATKGQMESTANITTSAISGLPIHASQDVEKPQEERPQPNLGDTQMKFFENLADESVEEANAADRKEPVEYSGHHGASASVKETDEPSFPDNLTSSHPRHSSNSRLPDPEDTGTPHDVALKAFVGAQRDRAYDISEKENQEPIAASTVDQTYIPAAAVDARQSFPSEDDVVKQEPSPSVADHRLEEVGSREGKMHATKSSE